MVRFGLLFLVFLLALSESWSSSDCLVFWFCLPCPNQGSVRTALPGFPACPVRIMVQFGLLFLIFLLVLSESRSSSDCSSWFSCLPCPNHGPVRTALSWFSCLPCPNQGSVRTALPGFPACPVRIMVQFGLPFLVFLLALSESRLSSDCSSWFSCLPCPNQGPVRTALPGFPACPVRIMVQFGRLFLISLLALSESWSSSDCLSWFSCLPCPNQGSVRTALPDFPLSLSKSKVCVYFKWTFLVFSIHPHVFLLGRHSST